MHALTIRDLTKTYKNGIQALKGIDLCVDDGEFFALLGPNGAGKSTTIGIITSLITKTSGSIAVFGVDVDRDYELAKSYIGLVPQEINFSQFESVERIVVNQAGYYGIPRPVAQRRAETCLRRLGLWERRRQRSRDLSGGMKRRLMIARALVHEPRLLILDEPTAGVDIELRRSMWDFLVDLNRSGTTIILTTHYLEEAERLCRHIAIIDDGVIIENTGMRDLLATLHTETFVLDLAEPVGSLPTSDLFELRSVDDMTIEVMIDKKRALNDVFDLLTRYGIRVTSMRNKSNRLEELFLSLVRENDL